MKYTHAFEIAERVLRIRQEYGETYRPDVVRTAALAAADTATLAKAADAIENAFHAARVSINPWDGSIA